MAKPRRKTRSKPKSDLEVIFVVKKLTDTAIQESSDDFSTAFKDYTEHFFVENEAKSVMGEEDVLKLDPTDFTSRNVFVVEPFAGPTFEFLTSTKATVVGPRCISLMIVSDIPLPIGSKPVMNMAMKDVVVTVSGLTMSEKTELEKKVTYMGGVYFTVLNAAVTHLISTSIFSQKYDAAREQKKQIMNKDWVDKVWDLNKTEHVPANDPQFDCYKLPIFYRQSITTTNLTNAAREKVEKSIKQHGGKYTGGFNSESTTVLLVPKDCTSSAKFQAAQKFKKLCLSPDWVEDSIAAGYAQPTAKYLVTAQVKASTPERKSFMPGSNGFAPNSTQLSEISCISGNVNGNVDETAISVEGKSSLPTRSSARNVTVYQEAFNKIDFSLAKKGRTFLDGCKIFLSGFKAADKEKLIKLLNLSGAIRIDELNDQVTHMIVGERVASDFNTVDTKQLSLHIVTLDWVRESLRMGEQAEEVFYLYKKKTENEKQNNDPEPPSPSSKKAIQALNHSFKRPLVPIFEPAPGPSNMPDFAPLPPDDHDKDNLLVEQYLQNNDKTSDAGDSPSFDGTEMHTEDLVKLDFFACKTVYVFELGFDKDEYTHLRNDCRLAKGHVVDKDFKDWVDIVLTANVVPHLDIPVKARKIVSDLWLEGAIQQNNCIKDEYYHKPVVWSDDNPPVFKKSDVFCISTYCGQERNFLLIIITSLGGSVSEALTRKDNPILVCPLPEGTKYEAALKWGSTIVTKDYVVDCLKAKKKLPYEEYTIEKCLERERERQRSKSLEKSNLDDSEQVEPEISTLNPIVPPVDATHSPSIEISTVSSVNPADIESWREKAMKLVEEEERLTQEFRQQVQEVVDEPDQPVAQIIKHKRVGELQNVVTPNNSPNVSSSDLTTPQRQILKRILEDSDDTPKTKRMKQLMKTPGVSNAKLVKTPKIPECLKTPDESYWPDDTPNSRFAHKRRAAALDKHYVPPVTPLKPLETPPSEYNRRWWKKMDSENLNSSNNTSQVQRPQSDENVSTPTTSRINHIVNSFAPVTPVVPDAPVVIDAPVAPVVPIAPVTPAATESKRSPSSPATTLSGNSFTLTPSVAKNVLELPDSEKSDDLKFFADYLKNQPKSGDDDNQTAPSAQKQSSELPVDAAFTQTQTERIVWHEPGASSDKRPGSSDKRPSSSEKRRRTTQQVRVMYTVLDEDSKLQLMELVTQLGGQNLVDCGTAFDPSATHMICGRPNRGEKFLASLAAGKWILTPKYVEDSAKAGYFLDEEEYEYGTVVDDIQNLNETETNMGNAAKRWRLKVGSNKPGTKTGAFSHFRIILHCKKQKEALQRIISAGGGQVLNVKPPYHKSQSALQATHCLVDSKTMMMEQDKRALKQAGVQLLKFEFLQAYLLQENIDSTEFLL